MQSDITYGPNGNVGMIITSELSDLLISHAQYQSNLPHWDKYLIWRYTLGSGTVTRKLVGVTEKDANDEYWIYQFFKYFNIEKYGLGEIGYPFRQYRDFFERPDEYLKLPEKEKTKIQVEILNLFPRELERIILASPPTKGPIKVYKVSGPYGGLPLEQPIGTEFSNGFQTYQKPFNSTTYDPQLDFGPFLGTSTCCFYEIEIPECSRVLAISPIIHAYPHENEILLPFGSTFKISSVNQVNLNTVRSDKVKYVRTQKPPYVLGQVYRPDPTQFQYLETRQVRIFEADLVTPYRSCPLRN